MAQLQVPSHSSEGISHSAHKRMLVTEASDIGYKGTGQLYDDAADRGIELVNPLSSNRTRWVLANVVQIPDDGISCWEFTPTPETMRRQPELEGYRLRIIND